MNDQRPGTYPLATRYGVVAVLVPIALVLLIAAAAWLRLRAEAERTEEVEALVTRTWISDRQIEAGSPEIDLRVEPSAPRLDGGGALARFAARFGLAALALVIASCLFGVVFGRYLAEEIGSLAPRFEALLEREGRSSRVELVDAPPGLSPLIDAALGLEERLVGELVMYSDAAEEVETVDARRTRFLSSVASELGDPLEKIVAEANDLIEGKEGELAAGQIEDLKIVCQAGGRLLDIAADILDFSSLIAKEVEFDEGLVDLEEICREIADEARGQLSGKEGAVEVVFEVTDPPPGVRGSRRRLWQVLTNLVSNGIKFTERGEVRISLGESDDGDARVEVADTGVGIAPEDLEAVFDPFRQRGEPSKRLRGTGLGLAIAKRLVELHGGRIDLRSKEHEGSVFTVILPGAP
jgi:signal transduction histidine kinase